MCKQPLDSLIVFHVKLAIWLQFFSELSLKFQMYLVYFSVHYAQFFLQLNVCDDADIAVDAVLVLTLYLGITFCKFHQVAFWH
jgi:hypothetical protein